MYILNRSLLALTIDALICCPSLKKHDVYIYIYVYTRMYIYIYSVYFLLHGMIKQLASYISNIMVAKSVHTLIGPYAVKECLMSKLYYVDKNE